MCQYFIIGLPAAAAGSIAELFFSSEGLNEEFRATGLRLRLDSVCLLVGERERRSKRDERLTSGSV